MSETPFTVLGLPTEADERTIKLTYARLVKRTRPDEDAEAFQRLNQAYRAALAICQGGTTLSAAMLGQNTPTPASASAAASHHPDVQDHASSHPPEFDGEAFISSLYQQLAQTSSSVALRLWLEQQPALWSLQIKQAIALPLLQRVAREQPPISSECFDDILRFFDLDQIRAGVDPLWMASMRRRLNLRWLLLAGQRPALMHYLGSAFNKKSTEKLLDQLSQPMNALKRWAIAVPMSGPGRVHQLLKALSQGYIHELPADRFDQPQLRFWLALTSPAVNSAKVKLLLLRGCFGVLAITILSYLVRHITGNWHFIGKGILNLVGLAAISLGLYRADSRMKRFK